MDQLLCAVCLGIGRPGLQEGPVKPALPAVTVYDGNAVCEGHFEIGFSVQPLERHRAD